MAAGTGATALAAPRSPSTAIAAPPTDRLLFIDNIRWSMIVLVLSMHACVTYSPFGGWYYRERMPMDFGSALIFAAYQSFLQGFFMSLLFFIAGYFAAMSCSRKGPARFMRDRAIRLGVPTALYMLTIGPAMEYFLAGTWGHDGFAAAYLRAIETGRILGQTGPMWFCAALLGFSVIYAALYAVGWREPNLALPDDWRGDGAVVGMIALIAAGTFLVRLAMPEGRAFYNMQFPYFAQYVPMFAAGLVAWRGDWFARLPTRLCRRWGLVALVGGAVLFAALIAFGGALDKDMSRYAGGFNWVSAGKCAWEALVCIGISLGVLALYQRHLAGQGPASRFMSDGAFGVYMFHPPILVALALAMHGLALPALLKAALLTALAALVTFTLSGLVLRRTPLLRAIV